MSNRNIVRLVVALMVTALPAAAQEPGAVGARTSPPPVLEPATAKALNSAIEALNKQKYDDALAAIATLDGSRLTPYERSKVGQVQFNVVFAMGRYDEARAYLETAIAAGGMNVHEVEQARYQIAQSFLKEQRWQEGATALEQWFASVPNPTSAAYYLLGVAYWQMGDYERALAPAQRAVDLADAPLEPWVALAMSLRLKRQEYQDAARLLQRLVVLVPNKKTYWLQLSAVYGQLKDYPGALAAMQVAYDAGLLTEESEIRRYNDLRQFTDLQQRGARALEDATGRQAVSNVDAAVHTLAN